MDESFPKVMKFFAKALSAILLIVVVGLLYLPTLGHSAKLMKIAGRFLKE